MSLLKLPLSASITDHTDDPMRSVTQAIDNSNDNSIRQVPMTVKDTILANASRDVYIL